MPYIDPEDQDQRTYVRFPGDPFPQDERHNDFSRREKPVPEVFVGGEPVDRINAPADEFEALMAAPGEYVPPADEADGLDEYDEFVRDAYVAALPSMTRKQAQAWELSVNGTTLREAADVIGTTFQAADNRLRGTKRKLAGEMSWVIAPELKAKYRKPKPPANPRPISQIRCSQHVGTWLARSDYDDAARWQVGRGLDMAIGVGSSPTDMVRRTQILPVRLAELISEHRKG